VSKKGPQKEYNDTRLTELVTRGAEHTTLCAGLGHVKPNGIVARGPDIPESIRRKVPGEADNCGGLEKEIRIAVGARVMLRRNIGTEDGLVNGVMGTVTSIEWPENLPVDHAERQPTAIHVLFDNERAGQKGRQFAWEREGNVGVPVPHTPVAITPATSRFLDKTKRHHLERYQFPLELAWDHSPRSGLESRQGRDRSGK